MVFKESKSIQIATKKSQDKSPSGQKSDILSLGLLSARTFVLIPAAHVIENLEKLQEKVKKMETANEVTIEVVFGLEDSTQFTSLQPNLR